MVSICAILLGFVLGVIVCFLRLSKNKIINKIAFVYVEIIRGTPILLQIAMVYYGLPMLGWTCPPSPWAVSSLTALPAALSP